MLVAAIPRHVLLELLKVLVLAACAITALFLLLGVATQLLPRGLSWDVVLQLLPYLVPEAARNALQGAMLYAVCAVYGRMSANNELLALKSLGISPLAVVWPALVLAYFLSLGCVWLYDVGESWGKTGVRRVAVQSVEDIAYDMLRTRHEYSSPRLTIHVTGVEGRRLIEPTLTIQPTAEAEPFTVVAKEAELAAHLENMTLDLRLIDGEAYVGQALRFDFPDTLDYRLMLGEASREDLSWIRTSRSMSELSRAIEAQQAEVQRLEGQHRKLGLHGESCSAELTEARQRLWTVAGQFHRRWANSFFCLAYAAVGIPVAIRLRGAHPLASFFLAFLPILLVNQPLHNSSIRLIEAGAVPAWCAWFSDAVLLAVGGVLLWRWRSR
jgi:lipopolysaccharide export system permease protein